MSLLESLSTGLRGAAGILSPDVQKQTFQQDQQNSLLQQQQKMQLLQHIQQQVQAGAVPADKVPFLAQKLGVPAEFLGGPGAEAQARLGEVERKKAFANAIAQLGPEPTQDQLAQVAAQFGTPDKVLDVHQKSIDRRETLAQKAQEFQQLLAQKEEMHRDRIQQAINAKASEERIAQMRVDAQRDIAQGRIDAQRYLATIAGSLRQPPQDQLITTETGIFARSRDGSMTPILDPTTGQPLRPKGTDKPMTEFQGKSALYGTRAAQSDKVLRSLEDKINLEGLATKQAVQSIPGIGGVAGVVGNALLSKEQQRVEQAQRDFVNAVLRQESGAVISDAEFENARKQYFPAPQDSKEVREQKRLNREIAISGFARMAGPGAEDINALRAAPILPGIAGHTANKRVSPPANGGWSIKEK
jgi:hypothetical protein